VTDIPRTERWSAYILSAVDALATRCPSRHQLQAKNKNCTTTNFHCEKSHHAAAAEVQQVEHGK
jgi:hypothetical protein